MKTCENCGRAMTEGDSCPNCGFVPWPLAQSKQEEGKMRGTIIIKAGVMVYTIRDGQLYSTSLPKEGAEIVKIVSQKVGKQFEALVRIRGHLWRLWSGKPVDEIHIDADPTSDEAARYQAQVEAAHRSPLGPWDPLFRAGW